MQMLKLQGTVLLASKDSELAYVSPGETPTVWVAEHHLPLVQLSLSAESHCRVTAGAGSVTRAGGACPADTNQQTFSQRAG